MTLRCLAVALLIPGGLSLVGEPQHPAIAALPPLRASVLRVDARSCATPDRVATGFLWREGEAVTALHAVAGCSDVWVYYEIQKLPRKAKVIRVLRRADLAILRIEDPPSAPALPIELKPPSLNDDLATLGYQLQIPTMSSTSLQLRVGGQKLGDIVNPAVRQQLAQSGSPSLDLEITNIEGHLVPGLSGAPVLNQAGRVVAIADGGLENGAVAISWAIPVRYLAELARSGETWNSQAGTQAGTQAATHAATPKALFASESDSKNQGVTVCGGIPLTKLRTASFPQIMSSADDPLGLQQLVAFFRIDPSGVNFDVYQHLSTGATVLVPAGAGLLSAGGQCEASLAGGKITMHIEVSVLNSPGAAQARSEAFERSVGGSDPQFWMVDPQWTYPVPYPRFDGLVVRRRAYLHVKGTVQDRYLFETLAFRGNGFIGSSTTNTLDWTSILQGGATCSVNPSATGCAGILAQIKSWVETILSVHLTTFPIG